MNGPEISYQCGLKVFQNENIYSGSTGSLINVLQ
jgi:hypothetical protein